MRRDRGFSVVELLVASAILLTVSAGVVGMLSRALAAAPVLEETTDLHQRARVASEAVALDARQAAAGSGSGALSRVIAAVEPRASLDPPGTATHDVLTLRYGVARGARGRLAAALDPSAGSIALVSTGCPGGTTACGFTAGSYAMLLDGTGLAAFVRVDATGPASLAVTDLSGARPGSFAAGAEIVEATEVTYRFDSGARQLLRTEGGGTFVVADNVVNGRFSYFDEGLLAMPIEIFRDGPFLGAGALAFDADLHRISTVRAWLRFETAIERMRGSDPRFFARPGTATGAFTLPDLISSVDVSLRNHQGSQP
jgi:prepilin-type N-terminal cleavage/methylation domain-containing protein